ncbi:MAG: EamA family transporter, partial [Bacteroidetes bacterium]|nr:EamA family transporter [Bacteroidota bacterium]
VRFGVAGVLMYGWLRLRGGARPSWRHWGTAALIGGLMLFVGTGSVAWAEQYIPSGLAALLVTTVPLWMVLLDWLWKGGQRPSGIIFVGLLLGFAGVVLLVDPIALVRHYSVDVAAGGVVFIGALAWATASIHARSADLPANPFMMTAMQMFAGGVVLMIGGSLLGEWRHFDVSALSLRSFFAWSYLVVFGAFIAHVCKDRHLLGLDQLRDFLDELGFLHLIGDFGDNNLPLAPAQILNLVFGAQTE